MLHHVAFEVPFPVMAAEGQFWRAAGFIQVPVPETLGRGFDWYEREGTQIHLMGTDDPVDPPASGHVAVVAPDIAEVSGWLEQAGFSVVEGRQLWGERRIKVTTPAGYIVEIMAAPPA